MIWINSDVRQNKVKGVKISVFYGFSVIYENSFWCTKWMHSMSTIQKYLYN